MNRLILIPLIACCPFAVCSAGDLILLQNRKTDYQIVLPDESPSEEIGKSLQQTARLMQVAFEANVAEVPVIEEKNRFANRPAIFLGNTKFARSHEVEVASLKDWSYVFRAVGQDIIIAGHDHPARGASDDPHKANWNRVGTAKAVTDFLVRYLGVRFLYPEIGSYMPISGNERVDLLNSPAIEFLPLKIVTVPGDLNVFKAPLLRVNTSHPAGGSFYDLALNRFPRVDEVFGGHTWERAIPVDKYWESHPEYFALINGQRLKPTAGVAQYCLSNPDVQQLILKDCQDWLERGFSTVDLGQPDGFRPCECLECKSLFSTGSDWSEKIWLFHKQLADKLQASYPGREVSIMSYIQTTQPPRSFKAFPPNTSIMLTGTNEEDIAPWRSVDVPRGFTGYIYNWCPNLASRYTPMRTPGFVEAQVKRLASNRVQSLYRDGPGQLFGLEGPVYYVMGRMFDDPQKHTAKDLLTEFYEGAFGDKSTVFYMRAFYDRLYHAITVYSDLLGTRCDFWSYLPSEGERPRKTVQDAFAFIAFLYSPQTIAELESNLTTAEKQARTDKVRTRLALIRTEFEYLKHFAKVVHLHQAYVMQPEESPRQRLMDAIEARNDFIDSLYDDRGNGITKGNWSHLMFPFPGHDAKHLRLAYDRYQEPFANTCFNWDTQLLRNSPPVGQKQLEVESTTEPLTLDSPQWENAAAHELTLVEPIKGLPRKTTLRLMWDVDFLYIYAESELPTGHPSEFPLLTRDQWLGNQESIDMLLQPEPSKEIFYRLAVGANSASRYDAVSGLITEELDPRFNKDDPVWNGAWEASSIIDAELSRWRAMIKIPFTTFNVSAPPSGTSWRANFGRNQLLPQGQVDRSIWSSSTYSRDINDRGLMGELHFK